jgi:hypothetical protein
LNVTTRRVLGLLVVLAAGAATFLLTDRVGTKAYEKSIEVSIKTGAIQPIALVVAPASDPGVLKWEFASSSTPGYIFPDKNASAPGIVFKVASAPTGSGCTATPDPGTVIHNCDAKLSGAQFHCNVKQGNVGDCYAYTVTVVPSGSASAVPALDPWFKQE